MTTPGPGPTSVADCRLVELPRIEQDNGSLTAVHGEIDVPFRIARVFYVYDVVGGAVRGGHAHIRLEQFVVAVMGSVTVEVDDGASRRSFELNRAYRGLYIPTHIWADLVNFSSGAVAVVLASLPFDESEYIRDHERFQSHRRSLSEGLGPG
jgi:dTDP-4-dehydrorhamnose 3,5-epimerase-like enzyme